MWFLREEKLQGRKICSFHLIHPYYITTWAKFNILLFTFITSNSFSLHFDFLPLTELASMLTKPLQTKASLAFCAASTQPLLRISEREFSLQHRHDVLSINFCFYLSLYYTYKNIKEFLHFRKQPYICMPKEKKHFLCVGGQEGFFVLFHPLLSCV